MVLQIEENAMTAPKTTYRWYLYRTVGGKTVSAARVTGATDCQVWNWNTSQWTYKPIAEQVEFSDTSWDEVTEDAVNQFTGEGVKP